MRIFGPRMRPKVLLDNRQLSFTIDRLCKQLIENHGDFSHSALIGVQPRGVFFADRLIERLKEMVPKSHIIYGKLDVTFYRDDFRRRDTPLEVSNTDIQFSVEGKRLVLIDDVLYTGRTIRAALDALLDYGRPNTVELLALIERRFSRHLPIQADYIGRKVDAIQSQKVIVKWEAYDGKDEILLISKGES